MISKCTILKEVDQLAIPLATNESYTNKSTGDKVTNTEWHNIVVRNKAAEICEKYLSKGDKIYLEGRIKNRKWSGEDGIERYTTEINVNEFTFLSTKKDSSQVNLSNTKIKDNLEGILLKLTICLFKKLILDPDPFLIIYLSILKSDLFWIQTLLVLILLFFSAVISGAEVAFFSLQVKSLEDDDKEEISISKKESFHFLKTQKTLSHYISC